MLLGLTISSLSFLVLDRLGAMLIDHYLFQSNYIQKKNTYYISKLETYVAQEKLSTKDSKLLNDWVKDQEILTVEIYKNDIQVFTSYDPNREESANRIEISDESWVSYAQVPFRDGTADVMITGVYAYQLRLYARIVTFLLCFVILLFIVLMGIKKKVTYIRRLSQDLEILEGGNLDYAVQVKGADELADLAQGIDNMRHSFQKLVETEAAIVKENHRVITEMSHDLRTPITSILLYLEIIKNTPDISNTRLRQYLETVEQKAQQMKQVSENLFTYSLDVRDNSDESELPLSHAIEVVCEGLQLQGFRVEVDASEEITDQNLPSEYLLRVFDNIQSNIEKYGHHDFPVQLELKEEQDKLVLSVSNRIKETLPFGNGIGLKSIERLMHQLGGYHTIETSQGCFTICLYFPTEVER